MGSESDTIMDHKDQANTTYLELTLEPLGSISYKLKNNLLHSTEGVQ